MDSNGSPRPVFESDEGRTSFVIRLPVQPKVARAPEVTPEVTPEVGRVVVALLGEWPRQQIQEALGLKDGEHFRKAYLLPSLEAGMVEMTLPDKPRSSKQRYRLTAQGQQWLQRHAEGGS